MRESETLRIQAEERKIRRQERIEKAKYIAQIGLLCLSLGAVTFSGYFPDYCLTLVGTGIVLTVVSMGWTKWDRYVAARQRHDAGGEEPLERIVNTLLLYAVCDGASQIRLRAGLGVQVHYFINDEWHEQMRIPNYIWMPIRELLFNTTNQWQKAVPFEFNERIFEFWPEFKHHNEYPLDELMLILNKIKIPAPLPEP